MTTTRIVRTSPAPLASDKLGRPPTIRWRAPAHRPCESRCAAAPFDRPADEGGVLR